MHVTRVARFELQVRKLHLVSSMAYSHYIYLLSFLLIACSSLFLHCVCYPSIFSGNYESPSGQSLCLSLQLQRVLFCKLP